ncbi:hypothetical protein SAMN04488069_107119 [Hymenobacter psychrophilus]|uniref:Uncharacterized protein n=2 Tax=Hymenobacter psychrophilus TaxID=651662 RepID=A0A1H3IT79_9BACT|nr:hypothetical protein SAMN04488069_107119 [Hymenobacter psychrophilus]
MEVRIRGRSGTGRLIELLRPGKERWELPLPAEMDQGMVTPALADYVTAQYLTQMPQEGIRLGWETIYALILTALSEALDQEE